MVFSSLPSYLDPSNWQQQNLSHHAGAGTANAISNSPQLPPQPPQQPPLQTHHVGGGGGPGVGSIRPGSMADRARLANVPMPEAALKCPRCESTNTKFCYFNNYSLSQPRHFCKTCRRYWTRGGALRNVPVGGGCRRNKRSKSGSSKSPCNSADSRSTASSNNTVSSISGTTIIPSTNMADILGLNNPQIPSIRFMAPLHHHQGEYSGSDIGLNYSGISEMNFHLGTNPSPTSQILGGSGLLWPGPSGVEPPPRLNQQFPFLAGLDASTSNLYQFEGGNSNVEMANLSEARKLMSDSQGGTTGISHVSPIKAEETPVELNLSRQVLGMSMSEETAVAVGSDQYNWGGGGTGGAWNTSDLFGLNSPNPTSHAL